MVKKVDYSAIVISDHAPVVLDLHFPSNIRECPLWAFNPLLLSNDKFCNFVSTNIDTFLEFNKTDTVSYSLLWETLKAYLRGQILSHTLYANKECKKELQALSQSILD